MVLDQWDDAEWERRREAVTGRAIGGIVTFAAESGDWDRAAQFLQQLWNTGELSHDDGLLTRAAVTRLVEQQVREFSDDLVARARRGDITADQIPALVRHWAQHRQL